MTSLNEDNYKQALINTEVEDHPGHYKRYSTSTFINSMDNYQAIACGLIMFENQAYAITIAEDILKNYPILNDQSPGKLGKIHPYEPSGTMQPHVWMMLFLAARRQPTTFQVLWYCGNLLSSAFFKNRSKHWASQMLAWLRMRAVERASPNIHIIFRTALLFSAAIYKWRMTVVSIREIFKISFVDPHPIYAVAPDY